MNEKIFVLANRKKTTSHVLHLVLSILTGGIWLLVWAGIAASNSRHNKKIDGEMSHILHYKEQGLDDVAAAKQAREDIAQAAAVKRRALVVVVVVVLLYLWWTQTKH